MKWAKTECRKIPELAQGFCGVAFVVISHEYAVFANVGESLYAMWVIGRKEWRTFAE
jgi:hypothetical protein